MAICNDKNAYCHQRRGKAARLTMASLSSAWAACAVLAVAGLIVAPGAAAQDVQSIQYASSDGKMISAYIAKPTAAAKSPAVILVHDDLGANKTFQDLARQCAEAGFVALVPNLPSRSGKPALEPTDGLQPRVTPVSGLSARNTVQDVEAAYAFLKQDSAVDDSKVSAVGVGWGAFRVWRLAEDTPTLYRAVVFYGVTPYDQDQLRTIQVPVLAHYAEQDYLITVTALKTKQLLGDKFTYHIYPTVPGFLGGGTGALMSQLSGTGQFFSMDGTTPEVRMAAAKQAWTRTIDFLRGGPATKSSALRPSEQYDTLTASRFSRLPFR
jgi:carboxymethylenebutenolidase